MNEFVHHQRLSPNHDARDQPISMVVLHYTGMQTAAAALARLTDPEAKVSAHYFIDEDGTVTQLVPENRRAWHAGKGNWRGLSDVNAASIGIELVNPGHEFGYRAFPPAQMEALLPLLKDIVRRNKIAYANVVGHSDIAPARKEDPGELFDWALLARHRMALPTPQLRVPSPFSNDGAFFLALERYGYDITNGPAAVRAFQRRWRPGNIDGVVDGETSAILFALLLERDQGRAR